MRKLVVTEFLTVDGVMEDPGGAEKFERGGWALQFDRGPGGDEFKLDELMASDTLLLGRKTYQGFAAAWPSRTGEYADKFNSMPKVVVSKTLKQATWNNSSLIRENIPQAIAMLKQAPGEDILVHGSAQLVQTLIQHDLVDEYRLMVFPVVLGKGRRMFNDGLDKLPLKLVEAQPVGPAGVITLVYQREKR